MWSSSRARRKEKGRLAAPLPSPPPPAVISRRSLLPRVHRDAFVLLVVGDGLVLRFAQLRGFLRLGRARLLGLRGLFCIGLRGGGGEFCIRRPHGADHHPGRHHDKNPLHVFSFMCGAPAGTAPPAGAREPDFTSLYQSSWCSLAQVSSV